MDNTVRLSGAYCRICAARNAEEHSIYELAYSDRTLSVHMMMQKFVPSVFNAEQTKVDEFLCWPRKICASCRSRVLEAYDFYELCLRSGDLLRERYSSKLNRAAADTSVDDSTEPPAKVHATKIVEVEEVPPKDIVLTATLCKVEEDVAFEVCPILVDDQDTTQTEYKERTVLPADAGKLAPKPAQKKIPKVKKTPKAKKIDKRKTPKVSTPKQQRRSTESEREQPEEQKAKALQFLCLLCDGDAVVYGSPAELTDHLKTAHPEQILSCDKCPKVFMTEQTMQHHQFCHATGQSYFCAYCDKGFQTERLLENHVRTHTYWTGFLCSQCGKEFSDRSNLRQHEYRHTGDKPWACSQCPSRFSTKGYLTVHLHTHTKAKRFSCATCGSQFTRHYSLVKHQVIHTGERHYACEVCKMRFASAHHVKIHMRTHTGEKPYKCGHCGRGFAQKNDMLKHTKTHGKAYPSERRDASFPQLNELRNHVKRQDQRDGVNSSSAEQ